MIQQQRQSRLPLSLLSLFAVLVLASMKGGLGFRRNESSPSALAPPDYTDAEVSVYPKGHADIATPLVTSNV